MRITFTQSPNHTKGRNAHVPDHFCLHTTGGTFSSGVNTVMNRASEVSYHFIISRTGEIRQFVNIADWAWANGTTNNGDNRDNSRSTLALVRQRRVNANWYTVSISFGDMPAGNPSREQLTACAWLMNHVNAELAKSGIAPIPLRRDRVVGHGEITPVTRPNCPGRAFPFDELIRMAVSGSGGTTTPSQPTAPTTPTMPKVSTTPSTRTYTVVKGDTMSGIARKLGTTLALLGAANPQIKDLNRISVGQVINLPATTPTLKPLDEIAREVINGRWGNGAERVQRLTEAGYDAKAVQARVNQLLR